MALQLDSLKVLPKISLAPNLHLHTFFLIWLHSGRSNGLSQSTLDKKRSTRCKTRPKSTRNGKFVSSSYRSGRSRRSRRYRKIYNCSTKRQNGDHAEYSKLHRVKI